MCECPRVSFWVLGELFFLSILLLTKKKRRKGLPQKS
jgi:hypothetical protein